MRGSRRKLRESGGDVARFVPFKPEPEKVKGLAADHPAVVEGRTLFPKRVTAAQDAAHFLIDGENNAKIGRRVTKGPWAGMPIFTLTLEERKTCPRSCAQWSSCYGSAMHWPKRFDAYSDDFMPLLAAEVRLKALRHPAGLVIRLHVLGDFFSTAYVRMWADLLDEFPQLHVFGFTARREDQDDEESRRIAQCIAYLTEHAWDQFAIRTSHREPGRQRAIVVMRDPEMKDVIVCPAQTGGTAACATCGLCWAEAARDKTIAFLKHGQKNADGPPKRVKRTAAPISSDEPAWLAGARARLAPHDKILRQKDSP